MTSQIDLQLASGEYFLKPHQKEAKEAQRRKEKVEGTILSISSIADPLNPARRGYRQAAGGTSRSVCTPEGRRSSYGGGEEETETKGEGGGRGGWRETAQEQEEKEENQRGGRLVSAFVSISLVVYFVSLSSFSRSGLCAWGGGWKCC